MCVVHVCFLHSVPFAILQVNSVGFLKDALLHEERRTMFMCVSP